MGRLHRQTGRPCSSRLARLTPVAGEERPPANGRECFAGRHGNTDKAAPQYRHRRARQRPAPGWRQSQKVGGSRNFASFQGRHRANHPESKPRVGPSSCPPKGFAGADPHT